MFWFATAGNPNTYYEYSYNTASVPAGTQLTFNNDTAKPVFISSQFTTTYVQRVARRLKSIRSKIPEVRQLLPFGKAWARFDPRDKIEKIERLEAGTTVPDSRFEMEVAANGSMIWKMNSARIQ